MSHWTEELFKDNPELFIGNLEARLDQVTGEVDFLLERLRENKFKTERILDFNCGIGRHAIELGKRGVQVLGTDISSKYLEVAGQRAREADVSDKVKFKLADMREIALELARGKPFDGIINMWTSFGYYDDKTNQDILKQCLTLVHPGGFFMLDIINRDGLLSVFTERGYSRNKDVIILQDHFFDPYTSRSRNTWTFMKRIDADTYQTVGETIIDHRIWSLHELITLFEESGWKFDSAYPGLAAGMVTRPEVDFRRSLRLLVICRRP